MRIQPNELHLALLRSIAYLAVQAQQGQPLDTGPGGEDAEKLTKRLREMEEELLYWLEPQYRAQGRT